MSFDATATGEHRVWRVRRPVIVAQVLSLRPDVLGVQETNQSSIYKSRLDYGVNQYQDLRGAPAAKGGHYALTNTYAYNCVNSATRGNRVQQEPRRVAGQPDPLQHRHGSPGQGRVGEVRPPDGLEVRVLPRVGRVRATRSPGSSSSSPTAHLDPYTVSVRKAQWDEVIANTKRLAGALPVMSVGDYNTSKYTTYAATYLPRMKAAGYGDVLGQDARVRRCRTHEKLRWTAPG